MVTIHLGAKHLAHKVFAHDELAPPTYTVPVTVS